MSPQRPSSLSIRAGSIALLLVLAATAPATVAAIDTASTAETTDATTDTTVGNLSAMLPPPGTGPDEVRSAAESGRLTPTDSVHPNGTVVFRLNGSTAAESANGSALGDELRFSMQQTERSTTPERLPLRLNTSKSGDAVRTFTVDEDRYVVVDLPNATWEYDGEPGTHSLDPRPRVGQGYVATLAVTSNDTTVSRNTTVHLTEPEIVGDSEVDAGGVAQLNVSTPGTWTATLVVGNETVGYRAALQVVDEDADGEVVVRVDTGAANVDAVFTAVGPDTVRRHPADDGFTTWNGTLPPGEYRIGAGVEDPETVAAERYDWDPVLTVVEATPASSSPTPTASPARTASSTPTATSTPTDATAATSTPAATTTESPGFGSVAALLALAAVSLVVGRRRADR